MEIRRKYDYEALKKFYPVLRREDAPRRSKKIRKQKPIALVVVEPPAKKVKARREPMAKKANIRREPIKREPKARAAQAPRAQKKSKKLNAKARQTRLAKKQERLAKMDGKLLTQLQMIQQRMETMDRDKERYALIDMTNHNDAFSFTVVRIGDPCKVIVTVDAEGVTNCSCMDWRIRCRNFAIPCKHLYYLFVKIITYELYDFFDNTITLPEKFRELVQHRVRINQVDFRVKDGQLGPDADCPVCFSEFKPPHNLTEIVQCADCKHSMHKDCMRTWLNHSTRRNCPVCRSEGWNMFFNL